MFHKYNGVVLRDTPLLLREGGLPRKMLFKSTRVSDQSVLVKGHGAVQAKDVLLLDGLQRYSDFIYYTSKSQLNYVQGLYEVVPTHIKTIIERAGYFLILTKTDIASLVGYDFDLADIVISAIQLILLQSSKYCIDISFYHAIGHALDFSLGCVSQSLEFRAIMQEEASNLYIVDPVVPEYAYTSAYEYFATVFHNILKTYDLYKSSAPRSYSYVERYVYGEFK